MAPYGSKTDATYKWFWKKFYALRTFFGEFQAKWGYGHGNLKKNRKDFNYFTIRNIPDVRYTISGNGSHYKTNCSIFFKNFFTKITESLRLLINIYKQLERERKIMTTAFLDLLRFDPLSLKSFFLNNVKTMPKNS